MISVRSLESTPGYAVAMGNVLTTVDARGNTTTYSRNELGEVYQVTMPAPYSNQIETSYDANRNMIQVDTQDMQVKYTSSDPASPYYAQFIPTGSGSTANVPLQAGPGGSVRSGWFSNLYTYDLIDNKIEDDIDATGSSPSDLTTKYAYDPNQNLTKIVKPLANTIEYDYDERNLKIAIRVGGSSGSVTIMAYDPIGNLMDVMGPATRGTAAQTLSAIIGNAFGSGSGVTFQGDWVAQNTFDAFDRMVGSVDAAGGTVVNTFDPGSRVIVTQVFGAPGGATPADRGGSANILLASGEARFDEVGRQYETQQDVFLDAGYYLGAPGTLPSGRAITHTGGGLATNSTANNHTATVTLTAGGISYVLSRIVFDRIGRVSATAADNGAVMSMAYDGADRAITIADALGNVAQQAFDPNGNLTGFTRTDICTISGSIPTESFGALMCYDVMNQLVVQAGQGADGSLTSYFPTPGSATLYTLIGRDSRGNRTNWTDAKLNTAVFDFDGASRLLETDQHLRNGGVGSGTIASTVVTKQAFDANSNLSKLTDSNGGATWFYYDLLDRMNSLVFYDSSTRTFGFDPANDITSYTDENGSVLTNTFDVLGRKVAVAIVPAAGVVGTTAQSFQFDGLSRIVFSRDTTGSGNTDASFIFDSISRVLEEQQTYAAYARYVTKNAWTGYAATGFTFPNNRELTVGFDTLYRKNAIHETSGGSSIAAWQFFGYRTATVTLGNGSIVTSFMNNAVFTDYAEARSAIQYGQTTPGWGSISTDQLGYDGAGRLIGKRHFSGSNVLVGFTSAYDPSSNKLFERSLHAESRASLYTYPSNYDSMNRLLNYQRGTLASGGASVSSYIALPGTNQEQDYNLDALSNWSTTTITPEGGSAAVQSRTHNLLNQITAYGVSPSSTPVLYDQGNNSGAPPQKGNGNIIDDGVRTMAYDPLNRLTTANRKSDGLQIAAYVYDALGRRVLKTVTNGGITTTIPNATSRYLYDGQRIVEELGGATGATAIQYLWGQYIDDLVQLKALTNIGPQSLASGSYYLLSDLLYRSAALTNSSGAVVEAYDTDAYGNTLLFSGHGADGLWFTNDDVQAAYSACRYVFTGRDYDAETAVYFYRSRHYLPSLGRFGARDPIGYADLQSLYAYTHGSVACALDPLGLDSGFWEYLKCAEPCLKNSDVAIPLLQWLLYGRAGPRVVSKYLGFDKDWWAKVAEGFGDKEYADWLRYTRRGLGQSDRGSVRNFFRTWGTRKDLTPLIDELEKRGKFLEFLAAIQAVADLAVHTHCFVYCCVLASRGVAYDPSQDHFIDDWITDNEKWITSLIPSDGGTSSDAPTGAAGSNGVPPSPAAFPVTTLPPVVVTATRPRGRWVNGINGRFFFPDMD